MVGYFVFTFSLPLGTIAPIPLLPLPTSAMLLVLCLSSFCLGASSPLYYELAAGPSNRFFFSSSPSSNGFSHQK